MDQLYQSFVTPPRGYRTTPWWIWNGRMEYPEMERQLTLMKEKGLEGWMLWVRFGIEIEYLSQEFFERIRFCVRKSAELGLDVWIFDEYAWPTGTAHNQVPRDNPKYRMRILSCFEQTVEGPQKVDLDFSGSDDPRIEKVLCVRHQDGHVDTDSIIDMSESIKGLELHCKIPSGRWKLLPLISRDFRAYIDALNPEVTGSFIEHVHERYKKWIGDYFGTTVKGFWLDEPRYLRFGQEKPQFTEPTIPWTQNLFDRMTAVGIKDVNQTMVAVFCNGKKQDIPLRLRFWRTLIGFYRDAFFGQLAGWAHENHLLYGGDCFTEDTNILACMGDYFQAVGPLDEPGMDILGIPEPYHFTPEMRKGAKFPSSLAHMEGKERCLGEGPGLLGWSATLEEMKTSTDLLYAGGINKMIPNALFYTISHEHYYETPSYFFQWPLWRYYDVYDQYVSRLGYMLTQGRHVAPVALYYPSDSFLSLYEPLPPSSNERYGLAFEKKNPKLDFLLKSSQMLADILLREQLDFDYAYDTALSNAQVQDGKIRIGTEDFEILMFPPLAVLSGATIDKIDELLQAGGKVMFVGGETVHRAETGKAFSLQERFPNAIFSPWDLSSNPETHRIELLAIIRDAVPLNVQLQASPSKDLFSCHHRRTDDTDLYFIANLSSQQQEAAIEFHQTGNIEAWDMVSAKRKVLSLRIETTETGVQMRHCFSPRESILLVQDRKKPAVSQKEEVLQKIPISNTWDIEFLDDNLFLPSGLQCSSFWKKRQSWKGIAIYRFEFSLEVGDVPSRLILVLDYVQAYWRLGLLKVWLNEQELSIDRNRSLDGELLECSIQDHVHPGTNRFVVEYEHSDYMIPVDVLDLHTVHTAHPPTPKIRIFGKFALKDNVLHKMVSQTIDSISWGEYGYPFYSGRGVYRQSFEVSEEWIADAKQISLEFEKLADIANIKVNGQGAGVVAWRPWALPVTEFIKPGRNQIEIEVTNTQANQMYEEPRESGILGNVYLVKSC